MQHFHGLYLLCGLLAGGIFLYLLAALFKPEDFA